MTCYEYLTIPQQIQIELSAWFEIGLGNEIELQYTHLGVTVLEINNERLI